MLYWGMIFGTAFLAIVLCKTCVQRRGRCDRIIVRENNQQNMPIRRPYTQNFYNHMNPIVQIPIQGRPHDGIRNQERNTEELDYKIQKYQAELIQLKQLKEKTLRQELLNKNVEMEIPMPRVNKNTCNYGPKFYGDRPLQRKIYQQSTDYSLASNQPF